MLDSNDILYTLISFLVVGIIFLSGVAVVFKILLKITNKFSLLINLLTL